MGRNRKCSKIRNGPNIGDIFFFTVCVFITMSYGKKEVHEYLWNSNNEQ